MKFDKESSVEDVLDYMGVPKAHSIRYKNMFRFAEFVKHHDGIDTDTGFSMMTAYVGIGERYLQREYMQCFEAYGTIVRSDGKLWFRGVPNTAEYLLGKPFREYKPPPKKTDDKVGDST